MEGDETLTLTEEKVSHPSTLEPARLTSKCLPFPVLEKSRKSYTLPKKGMSNTNVTLKPPPPRKAVGGVRADAI